MLEKLESIIKGIHAGKVLDIASGAGDFIDFIKNMNQVESVTAIDEIEKMEEFIKKRHPEDNINFKKMNAHHLEFEDSSFDTVCISNSLHHLSELNQVISEAIRVLKKDGFLVINEMCCDGLTLAQQSHRETGSVYTPFALLHKIHNPLRSQPGLRHKPYSVFHNASGQFQSPAHLPV